VYIPFPPHVLVPCWATLTWISRFSKNKHINVKEVAQNFKEQGNEYFRGKMYREALGFYTQGVDAKPDDVQLKEALLLNRAACNLELRASLHPSLFFPPVNLIW
jgi:hypothetical protein